MERDKVDPQGTEFLERIDELAQAASKPVVPIDHNGIDQSLPGIGEQAIKLRPALFRAADAGINVFAQDLPAAPVAVLAQFEQLHLRSLAGLCRGHSRIK